MMKQVRQIIFLLLFLFVSAAAVCAAQGDITFDPVLRRIFTITIIVSVIVAVALVNFARRSSNLKRRGPYGDESSPGQSEITPAILDKIENLSRSNGDLTKTAASITDLFNEKLEEKVATVKQDLDHHYGKLIEEKELQVSAFQKKYKKTEQEKQQTEAVIHSVAEGLVVINNKGEVLLMNPAAEKLLDAKQEKKIGKTLADDLKDGQMVTLTKEASTDAEREIELKSKNDATRKVIRSSSAVIEDENGKTVGMVSVLTDITKQKELDELKAEFVSKVSHELRTPLVAMQQSIAVMLNKSAGPITEAQQKFLSIAERNLKRLSRMIDELLDLSKLEANKMELASEDAYLADVIKDVCETVSVWAGNKSIELINKCRENLPALKMDPQKITQVLNNLIGNAIKFTPQKGTITVEAKPSDKNGFLEVSVADTGVGIEKEDLGKVFNKFQQVGGRAATDISGTGLGLSIAKEIVELHKGTIWVESEKGQGTKFTFTLPT